MPVQLSPKRQIKGIYSNFNHSSGIPEGGLLEADNCVIDRPGVLSKRKGFDRYGPEKEAMVTSLMDYNGSLLVHSGSNISCDADGNGTLTSWGDTYETPGGAHTIRGASLKRNFYFTSRGGVYRNDSLTSKAVLAGMPEGLDVELTKVGTGGGFFTNDKQISYRIVWTREDAHKGLIVGQPSLRTVITNAKSIVNITHNGAGRAIVAHTAHGFSTDDIITISDATVGVDGTSYNGVGKTITALSDDSYSFEFDADLGETAAAAGKDYNIDLKFTVPDGIVAGDKYEIYRTEVSASATTDPGTEHYNVIKKEIAAAEVTEGTVEFSDTTLDVSLGDHLYTNSTQESDSQANYRPPQCKDIAEYRGHMFCSDLTYRAEKEIHLSEIKDIVSGDSISVEVDSTTLTYKFDTIESINDREFKLHTAESTTENNIEITAQSLVRVINRDPNNDRIYAYYSSGVNDAAGKVLIKVRDVNFGAFSITANSTTVGESFKEVLPVSGETFSSEENTVPNGLAYSKVLEPDAMPHENIIHVGDKNEPIQRIIALKTSLLILKNDGAYKLSGNTPATFVLAPLDLAVSFKFPNAAALMNDSVYCLSTQGILRVGENGTSVVSYPIEDKIRNIASFPACDRVSFIVVNEENRRLLVFTQGKSGDRWAKVGWAYNYLTKEWTTWSKEVSCGVSIRGGRDTYLGDSSYNYVLKERNGIAKRNSSDYMDESIGVSVSSHGTTTDSSGKTVTTITLAQLAAPHTTGWQHKKSLRAGFLVRVGTMAAKPAAIKGKIASVSLTSSVASDGFQLTQAVLTMKTNMGLSGACTNVTISLPIDSMVKWAPDNIGVSEYPKQFTYATITMQTGTPLTNELGFYSDGVPVSEWVGEIAVNEPLGWGDGAWGSSAWGSEDTVAVVPFSSPVPRQHQRCRELTVMYRHRVAGEEFDIESIALRYKMYKGKLVRTPE